MKVEELIEKLNQLPKDLTIGTFDEMGMSVNNQVFIYTKDDVYYGYYGETTVGEIENSRLTNNNRKCDFYIGY